MQKSSFLSDHLNYCVLKDYYDFFGVDDTKNKLPTSAVKQERLLKYLAECSIKAGVGKVRESSKSKLVFEGTHRKSNPLFQMPLPQIANTHTA